MLTISLTQVAPGLVLHKVLDAMLLDTTQYMRSHQLPDKVVSEFPRVRSVPPLRGKEIMI
jgi:hypothetical protein